MHTLLLLFLSMQKFVPKGSDSECWCAEKLCLVLSDVCYGVRATIVAPSAYASGLYVGARKGYCLLLAQHCARQTKRTCIKGLDSSSLFMWKWIPFPKGTKQLSPRGYPARVSGQAGGRGTFSPAPAPAKTIHVSMENTPPPAPSPPTNSSLFTRSGVKS